MVVELKVLYILEGFVLLPSYLIPCIDLVPFLKIYKGSNVGDHIFQS